MNFCNLKSGSKGNCSFIFNDETLILIDFGITKSELHAFLKEINKDIKDINCALLTHNHIDYISGYKFVPQEKIHCLEGMADVVLGNNIKIGEKYIFNTIEVEVIKTYHDTLVSSGFIFKDLKTNEKLSYITDTGYLDIKTLKKLKNLDYYVMESNHDVYYLLTSKRPDQLKRRILMTSGHLSNDLASLYLKDLVGRKTKKIMLAHLSEECNRSDLAIKELIHTFDKYHINHKKIEVVSLEQWGKTWLK